METHPLPKGGGAKNSARVYCGQTAGCIKIPLGMEVDRSPGDFVLDGDSAPIPKKGAEPSPIPAHVYYGQTAAWIKMPLGIWSYRPRSR